MTFGSTFGRVFSPTFQPKSQAAGGSPPAWTPNSISGCAIWLDFSDADTMFTDAGTTKVANDGDLIYQINDKSGNSVNATQTTSGNRPTYKVNINNSLSAALIATDKWFVHSYPLGTATDFTLFMAIYNSTLGNYTSWVGNSSSSTYWGAYAIGLAGNGVTYAGVQVTNRIVSSAGWFPTYANITISLRKNGSGQGNLSLTKNGGTAITNGTKTEVSPTSATIALPVLRPNTYSGLSPSGYIYEYIVYNTALSDTDRGSVETYLNNKWAIY